MKNIISWTTAGNFLTFRKRLMKRIDHVCRPLWKKESIEQEVKKRRNEFMMLSVYERVWRIREGIQNFLIARGWHPHFWNKHSEERNAPDYFWRGRKIIQPAYFDSATQKHMFSLLRDSHEDLRTSIDKGYECHFYVIALRKIPNTRVESTFMSAATLDYCRIIKASDFSGHAYYVHFMSGLRYPEEYIEEFQSQTKYNCGIKKNQ